MHQSIYSVKRRKNGFLCTLIKSIIKLIKITRITINTAFFALIISLIFLPFLYADNIKEVIDAVSRDYQIPAELIYKVIEAESSFNPYAVSQVDARGLMQITRPTWDWICQEFLHVSWSFDEDSFDSVKNIIVGTRFLAWIKDYLNKYKNELNATEDDLLLACYNAGPGTVKKYGFRVPPFEETQNYVAKINADLR